jgi:hypothetical protein
MLQPRAAAVRVRTRTTRAASDQANAENAYLRQQHDKKDQQLERHDRQVEAMIERDRETDI